MRRQSSQGESSQTSCASRPRPGAQRRGRCDVPALSQASDPPGDATSNQRYPLGKRSTSKRSPAESEQRGFRKTPGAGTWADSAISNRTTRTPPRRGSKESPARLWPCGALSACNPAPLDHGMPATHPYLLRPRPSLTTVNLNSERGHIPITGSAVERISAPRAYYRTTKEDIMGRGILLWLLGVPIPIIILLALLWH